MDQSIDITSAGDLKRWTLPADLKMAPSHAIPARLKEELECGDDDILVTRPNSRSTSKVLSAEAAGLLSLFKEAQPIVAAVLQFAKATNADPFGLLNSAFPILKVLIAARFLVPEGSEDAHAIQPSIALGHKIEGWLVTRAMQIVEDTELYEVVHEQNDATGVLKILRPGASHEARQLIKQELEILSLRLQPLPALHAHGREGDRIWLVMEFIDGANPLQLLRQKQDLELESNRETVLRICTEITRAYAELHALGILHGDVHPRNLLITPDGRARIIDFGLASTANLRAHSRGGVHFYFEPEFAALRLDNKRPPDTTAKGEQYSLGALLYQLTTGKHYLDFSAIKLKARRQIVAEPPWNFSQYGKPTWSSLENILGRALAKTPEQRFESTQGMLDALLAADLTITKCDPKKSDAGASKHNEQLVGADALNELSDFAEQFVVSAQPGGLLAQSLLASSPRVSVNFGASGIAFALARIASMKGSPRLRELADLWLERAEAGIPDENAFAFPADSDTNGQSIKPYSVYHHEAGVHCVAALLASLRGDVASESAAIRAFTSFASEPMEGRDLTLGTAGSLLSCAFLRMSAGANAPQNLVEYGDRLCEHLEAEMAATSIKAHDFAGVAHGWAGALYACLAWKPQSSEVVLERLQDMTAIGQTTIDGTRWPRKIGSGQFLPSWCNGTAGFIFLWVRAYSCLKEREYLDFAESAADYVWATRDEDQIFDLCCGKAGRAYSLLSFYRATGETKWLQRATELALLAVRGIRSKAYVPHSLYRGITGVALLAAEIQNPMTARMPLFEFEPLE